MTNRIDHTRCTHTATPSARAACRRIRRDDLATARAMFMEMEGTGIEADEYDAFVDLVALRFGLSLDAMYDLIEHGEL